MILNIWKKSAALVAERPVPFLTASILLAATNLLEWHMGLLDGVKPPAIDRGILIFYVISKLIVSMAWLIAALRLAWAPAMPLLKLSKRQIGWLASLGGFFLISLTIRLILTRAAASALAPFAVPPVAILMGGLVLYMMTFMYFQMRLAPAIVGVLLGEAGAGLGWSWAAMKGHVGAAILAMAVTIAPFYVLHIGNNILWVPKEAAPRLAVLLADGAVMAALILASSVTYAIIHEHARLRLTPAATPKRAAMA